jgi:hypothetical protein
MTDDLVKRLRCYADLNDAIFHPWVYGEAADRIEQLEDIIIKALNDVDCSEHVDLMLFDWLDEARAALGKKKDG